MHSVSSYESYQLLVVDRHRTPDEYERWLGDILCDLLLESVPDEWRIFTAES